MLGQSARRCCWKARTPSLKSSVERCWAFILDGVFDLFVEAALGVLGEQALDGLHGLGAVEQ